MMKDLLLIPSTLYAVAQIPLPATPDTWERLTIAGLSIMVTVFLWRYFTAKEKETEVQLQKDRLAHAEADILERNRLLDIQNRLQAQVVQLLKEQRTAADLVAERLIGPTHTIIDNKTADQAIPMKHVEP